MPVEVNDKLDVVDLVEWLDNADNYTVTWLLKDFIRAQGLTILSGQSKLTDKTTTMELMVLALASGKKLGPFEPTGAHNVLLVEEEGSVVDTRDRIRALMRTYGLVNSDIQDKVHFMFHPQVMLDEDEIGLKHNQRAWRYALEYICLTQQITVAFFDCVTFMLSGDENDAMSMKRAIATLATLRNKLGVTPVAIMHLPKEANKKQDIDKQPRGSAVWANSYDMHIALRRYKDTQRYTDVVVRGRSTGQQNYSMHWSKVSYDDGSRRLKTARLSLLPAKDERKGYEDDCDE